MRSPRIPFIGVTALALGLAVVLAGAPAVALTAAAGPAEAASSVRYVALGDSHSSGAGAGNQSGSCGRSPGACGPL